MNSKLKNALRMAQAASLQSLAVLLAALLAFPPHHMQAQQKTEATVFVPEPLSLFDIINPPVDLLGNVLFSPPQASKPINITPFAGTTLANSGLTLVSTSLTIQGSTSICLNNPLALNCQGSVNLLESGVANLSSTKYAPEGCTLAQNQAQIVQCINYATPRFEGTFPATWETTSLAAYMVAHGHPPSDLQYIYQYGRTDLRDEVRGWLLSQVFGIIKKVQSNGQLTSDEQAVYYWLQTILYGLYVEAAQASAAEYQTFAGNPCGYNPNQAVQNALGVYFNTGVYCPGNALTNTLGPPPYPAASYFQAVGHATAFETPLGVVGTNSLVTAQSSLTRFSPLVSQTPPSSNLAYISYLAAPTAAIGVGPAIYTQFSAIAPFRNAPAVGAALRSDLPPAPKVLPSSETSYTLENAAPETVTETEAVPEIDALAEATTQESVALIGETASVASETAVDALDGATTVVDTVAAGSAASVVGVVLFALMSAITESLSVAQSNQNQTDDQNLAAQATALQKGSLPDLTQLYQTKLGQLEICEAFILATLPELPSTAPLPSYQPGQPVNAVPLEGFYSRSAVLPSVQGLFNNQTMTYLNTSATVSHTAQLWNGFFILDNKNFALSLTYTDDTLIERRATRVAPNLFEVEPAQITSNAPFCPADPTTGVTTSLPAGVTNIKQCGSAVLESLNMFLGSLSNFGAVYISTAPVLNDQRQIGVLVNSPTPLNFTPGPSAAVDPLGQIPCDAPLIVAAQAGQEGELNTSLPPGITIANQHSYLGNNSSYPVGTALVGTATGGAGNTYAIPIIDECGTMVLQAVNSIA